MNENATPSAEQARKLGFELDFGSWTRSTKLHVMMVVTCHRLSKPRYGIYVFHGHPGGEFWRNSAPLLSCSTEAEAYQACAVLLGVANSRPFVARVDRIL